MKRSDTFITFCWLFMICFMCFLFHVSAQVADITIPPKSLNISLNEVAEFNCTAVANAFVWRKNRMDITTGITTVVVDQVQSVGMSTLRMTVSSLMDNAANITCTAVKSIPFSNDESEPALLLIQGLLEPVINLTVISINSTTLLISWIPPFTLEGVPILGYNVTIRNNSNTSEMNKTFSVDGDTTMVHFSIKQPDFEGYFAFTVVSINKVGVGNTATIFYKKSPSAAINRTSTSAPISTTTETVIYTTAPSSTLSESLNVTPSSRQSFIDAGILAMAVILGFLLMVALFAIVLAAVVYYKRKQKRQKLPEVKPLPVTSPNDSIMTAADHDVSVKSNQAYGVLAPIVDNPVTAVVSHDYDTVADDVVSKMKSQELSEVPVELKPPELPGTSPNFSDDSLTAADDVSDQANEMLAADNVPIDNPAAIDSNPPITSNHKEKRYFGNISRSEAEAKCCKPGDYLVRYSSNLNKHMLTVMNGRDKIDHIIIKKSHSFGSSSYYIDNERMFTSINNLLDYYRQTPLPGVPPLDTPLGAHLINFIYIEQWDIDHDDITSEEKIADGKFGDVYKGWLISKNMQVTIKTCRKDISDADKTQFRQEADNLKQLEHPNIVVLVGIVAEADPLYTVFEYYSAARTFLVFLHEEGKKCPKQALTLMCTQVCDGMKYLEEKEFVHHSLSVQNCVVHENNVKIANFGFGHTKWTDSQINHCTCTSACDVWSFGILMWRTFSFGADPYDLMGEMEARDMHRHNAKEAHKLLPQVDCPKPVYDVMKQCWFDEKERPMFADLHSKLKLQC